jgi:ribonuclease E
MGAIIPGPDRGQVGRQRRQPGLRDGEYSPSVSSEEDVMGSSRLQWPEQPEPLPSSGEEGRQASGRPLSARAADRRAFIAAVQQQASCVPASRGGWQGMELPPAMALEELVAQAEAGAGGNESRHRSNSSSGGGDVGGEQLQQRQQRTTARQRATAMLAQTAAAARSLGDRKRAEKALQRHTAAATIQVQWLSCRWRRRQKPARRQPPPLSSADVEEEEEEEEEEAAAEEEEEEEEEEEPAAGAWEQQLAKGRARIEGLRAEGRHELARRQERALEVAAMKQLKAMGGTRQQTGQSQEEEAKEEEEEEEEEEERVQRRMISAEDLRNSREWCKAADDGLEEE